MRPYANRRLLSPLATTALLAGVLAGVGGCNGVFWRPDLGGAVQLASQSNRVVVAAYWAAFNPDCQRMESEVFSDEEVQRMLRSAIPVKIDAFLNPGFGKRYGVTRVPAFVIFGPDGRVLRRAEGFMDEGRFRGFVEAAKLSL